MEATIDPEYKDTMNEFIRQFEKVDKEDYTKENYITLLKNIYDLSKEYKLSGKYKTCTGNKLSNVCNVDSIIDCQKNVIKFMIVPIFHMIEIKKYVNYIILVENLKKISITLLILKPLY